METRKIIDILNSRDVEEVTAWLKKFPNIKIFNRDGSYNYARAISQAHPEAQQISDYFHLVKNLSEYLKDYLLKKLPKVLTVENKTLPKLNIEILKKKELYSSEWEFAKAIKELHSSGKNFSEIGKIFNLQYRSVKKYIEIKEEECLNKELTQSKQKKKQKLVERVKELYRSGKTYKYIGEILDLDYKTIKKYIEVSTPLVYRTIERTSSITPYKNEVIQLLNKRVSKKEIYNILKEKGYKQAMRTFYNSVSKIVKEYYDISDISQKNINSLRIKVSKITKLLYYPLEKIEGLDENIYKQIIKEYSWVADILNIMKNFKIAVKEKNINKYLLWLENLKNLNISELNGFIKNLEKDYSAIINAISYRYTNGLAEGLVNKLKTIKRSMYGKASFQTLRRKILWSERD